jgi:hypothetical protein
VSRLRHRPCVVRRQQNAEHKAFHESASPAHMS